jgi:5-methylcytosine-specific restriction endonuclease McrA
MRTENSKCLVLNADYSPLCVIGWKRALIWSLKHNDDPLIGVEVIDFYKNDFITGTNNRKFPIPAVVKTVQYFRLHDQRVNFSRKNIFIRDNYTCQYCSTKKDINELTYDHVIPKSKWTNDLGTPTNWTNIVTACVSCNRKKGNRTPKQANMPLKNNPVVPVKNVKYLPLTHYLLKIRSDIPQEWTIYLPESYL